MINQIETGYKPEFSLGAWYAAENANAARQANEEELLRQRLANQQSQVMNPLEAQLKQLSIAPAQYEEALSKARLTDPEYIRSMLNERKGQAALAEVTGRKAKALEPFATKAEQFKLENEAQQTDLLSRFSTIQDDLLAGGGTDPTTGQVVPYTPAQRQAAQNYSQGLLGILKNTPKFAQDKELKDDAQAARLAEIEARHAGDMERARIRAEADIAKAEAKGTKGPDSVEKAIVNEILTKYPPGPERDRQLALAAELIKKVDTSPKAGVIFDAEGKPSYGQKDREYWPGKPTATPITNFSKQDEQALAWANANPTDPRAIAIKKKLGVK